MSLNRLTFLLVLLLNFTVSAAAAVKLSNLTTASFGAATVSAANFKAQPFRTTAIGPFEITSLTLKMAAGADGGGQFTVGIYSGESAPATLVPNGVLIGESNPLVAGDYTYTASGLTLDPNSTYWIVARVTSGAGSYRWAIAANATYQVAEWASVERFGQSANQGSSWAVQPSTSPYFFSISNSTSGAQTLNGSDDFNDNDLGPIGVNNRWRFNTVIAGTGTTAFTNRNGFLDFTAGTAGGVNTRALGWISPSSSGGAYGFDWVATVTVRNAALAAQGYTLAGVEIYKLFAASPESITNNAYYGVYLTNAPGNATTRVQAEWGAWNPAVQDFSRNPTFANLAVGQRSAILRLNWTAATRVLAVSYSVNGGQSFTTLRTFALAGAQGGLGAPFSNGFGLQLVGVSDRTAVAPGDITYDDMVVTSAVAPAITTQPVAVTVTAGHAASFAADVAGSRPLTYQWFRNDVAIVGATSPALRLPSTTAADAGAYKLTATNSLGSATTSPATLTVNAPLTITTQPRDISASEGNSASFTVAATASGALTYQWRRNGVNLTGATAATLAVNPVTAASYGTYSVLVSTIGGSLESATAQLLSTSIPVTVPTITQQPRGVTISPGSTLVLGVAATGVPAPTYQWSANGATLPGATSATLVLTNTQPADSGIYTVTVSTLIGRVTSDAAVVSVGDGFSRQLSLSTRGFAGADSNTLIPAFFITGSNPKRLLIRAAGPALAQFGVAGSLSDPQLEIKSGGVTVLTNDNWSTDAVNAAAVRAAATSVAAFPFAEGSRDAAVVVNLPPGSTSILVTGVGGATGEAIVEVYDLDASDPARSRLANLSTRAFVPTGGLPLISGFVVQGVVAKPVLVRATGPALAGFGVAGAMARPRLTLFDSGGRPLATNIGWESAGISNAIIAAGAGVGAFPLTRGSADSVIFTVLPPGGYTAQIEGADGTGGVALIEVYELP